MRILQVCSADAIGGGERHVAELADSLSRRGHEVHLAVRPGSPLRGISVRADIQWHEVPLRNGADFGSAISIARLVRSRAIDVLHGHVARDYPVCGLAARMSGARLFLTRHHYRAFPRSLVYQWAISPVTQLIAVSSSVAAGLSRSFPALAGKITVIPNWIDSTTIAVAPRLEARRHLGIDDRLAVGVIGQLNQNKGQDVFLRAAAQLKESGIDDVQYVVIGEGTAEDAAFSDYLRVLTAELGLSTQVHFTGAIEQVSRYLSALDIVIVPSKNEAFSLVTIEAMAAGLPVVATDAGGPGEIIAHGETGLLVARDEIGPLVEAMEKLVRDESLRKTLGAAARIDALRRFDRERVIDRIEGLYQAAGK